ncbi:MAG: hypothetical protein ACP5T3_00035 [Candidatus Micrarchaeia archaeon]
MSIANKIMDGEAIKLYLFDFGTELQLDQVKNLFKNPEDFSKIDYNLPTPEEIPQFTLPAVFNMKGAELQAGSEKLRVKVQIAIFALGTISIRIRLPLEHIEDAFLTRLAVDPQIEAEAYKIAQQAKAKVKNTIGKQLAISEDEFMETYNFYFINDTKENVLKKSRNTVAGLLVSEGDVGKMDSDYVHEILNRSISYYNDDAFFVGWDGAVLIDILKSIDYELLMAEIANMQLLKLRIYKKKTSEMLEQTGADVEALGSARFMKRIFDSRPIALSKKLGGFLDALNEMLNRIDNTVFGLGEWYLSKIYALFSSVFKLAELKGAVEGDANKLAARKELVNEIIAGKRNDTLEFVVILLIVLEILVEFAYFAK